MRESGKIVESGIEIEIPNLNRLQPKGPRRPQPLGDRLLPPYIYIYIYIYMIIIPARATGQPLAASAGLRSATPAAREACLGACLALFANWIRGCLTSLDCCGEQLLDDTVQLPRTSIRISRICRRVGTPVAAVGGASESSCKRRYALPGAAVERQGSVCRCVTRRRRKCLDGVERRCGGCGLHGSSSALLR
jgi:hypothetical protein